MGIHRYLAMTAAEIRSFPHTGQEIAWMSCLFSPYGTGLSNLPEALPEGSLLILSDLTPFFCHDPRRILDQLQERLEALSCSGLLLDLQRPGNPEAAGLCELLLERLPCPVAVSEPYAAGLSCPVLLPPAPLSQSLGEYLRPWQEREIWLELAQNGEVITLTENGAEAVPVPFPAPQPEEFADNVLHCHYRTELLEGAVRFTLRRTREDLDALMEEAESLGVTTGIGLFQEFGDKWKNRSG